MNNYINKYSWFTVLFALGTIIGFISCGGKHETNVSSKSVVSVEPPKTADSGSSKNKELLVLNPPSNRTVYIVGEIDSNALGIAAQITALGASSLEPIFLEITSPGGSVLTGGQIVAAIESSKAPVYTICNVLCASMAAMIFEYGSQRYIGDRSFVMFHPASGGADGELDKMVSRLTSMQRYIGKMEAHIAKRAGLTFEQYKAKAGVEAWIDGEDAVNSGFADKIATVVQAADSPYSSVFGRNSMLQAITMPDTYITTTMPPVHIKW